MDIDKAKVLCRVEKAMESQFESYTWGDMLDDCGLDDDELVYARESLSYKVYDVDEANAKSGKLFLELDVDDIVALQTVFQNCLNEVAMDALSLDKSITRDFLAGILRKLESLK